MKKRYIVLSVGVGMFVFPLIVTAQDYNQEQYDAYYYASSL